MKPEIVVAYDLNTYVTKKAMITLEEKMLIDSDDASQEDIDKAIANVGNELDEQNCIAKTAPFETSDGRTIQFLFFDKLPADYVKYIK